LLPNLTTAQLRLILRPPVSEEREDQMRTRFTTSAAIAIVAPDLRLGDVVPTAARRCASGRACGLLGIDEQTA